MLLVALYSSYINMITNDLAKKQEALDILKVIKDNVDDLARFSVNEDDCFNSEVYEMYELIKRARKQL